MVSGGIQDGGRIVLYGEGVIQLPILAGVLTVEPLHWWVHLVALWGGVWWCGEGGTPVKLVIALFLFRVLCCGLRGWGVGAQGVVGM